jgi:hypothetical protein
MENAAEVPSERLPGISNFPRQSVRAECLTFLLSTKPSGDIPIDAVFFDPDGIAKVGMGERDHSLFKPLEFPFPYLMMGKNAIL